MPAINKKKVENNSSKRVIAKERTEEAQAVLIKIGEELKKHRTEQSLSLIDMCVATGRSSPTWFSAVEKGRENLTIETLVSIASALGKQVVVKLV